jgi:tryptophan-rich sensory protein
MSEIRPVEIGRFAVSIVLCQLAGFIGSLFTSPAIPTWYAALEKPSFNPPNWLFAPVWTVLFLLMGISLYLVWRKSSDGHSTKTALAFFALQLTLNVLWSMLFFGLRSPLAGLMEIIVLWTAILLTLITFYRISKPAGLLLIPYILWVSFAAVLNYHLWRLNA